MPRAGGKETAPRHRARRWLKWLGIGLASLVGLVLLLVAAAFLFLSTHAGSEKLRGLVVSKANDTLEGHLTVGSLSLHGGHLVLHDVVLDDPQGHEVARVAEVEVRVALGQLLHKTLDLKQVRLENPVLHIVQDATGSNLQRALASRHPSPQQPSNGKSSLVIAVDDLQLDRGVIDLLQVSAQPERHLHLSGLAARGHARTGGARLSANLSLHGEMTAPVESRLSAALEASGAGDAKQADVRLSLGEARLVAHAELPDPHHTQVRIDSLVLPPKLASALVPSYPLQVPLRAHGTLRENGKLASVQLDAAAGKASVSIQGSYDLLKHRSDGLQLRARHLDLTELTPDGPASDIAVNLDASGGGTSADDAVGRVALFVPPSLMQGEQMGPIRLEATADHGHYTLEELNAHVPGVALFATGNATRTRVDLHGELTARNLDAFSKTLGRLGKKRLSLSGSGQLQFAARGPLKDPTVELSGAFPSLRYQDKRLTGLSLEAHLPQVKHPGSARLALNAKTVTVAPKKQFRDVHVRARGSGDVVALNAEVHGFADLTLALTAQVDRDDRGGVLRTLTLQYPEAKWALVHPVRLSSRGKSLRVGRLELRADRQRIALEANRRGNELHARVDIRALDLSRLPKAVLDPSLRLAGRLDVNAKVDGPVRSPEVVAKVDLQHGRFKKYTGVGLHLDASYVKERARGELTANGAGVQVSGRFDVPVRALKTGGPEPVQIDARLARLDLGPWLQNLGIHKPIRGLAEAQLTVTGTASNPRLNATASLHHLKVRQAPPTDVMLTAKSGDSGRLLARADLELEGKKSEVLVQTPFSLGELLRNPPKKAALMDAPLQLTADLRQLPLRALSQAGLSSTPLTGTLSGQGRVHGTPKALTGTLSLAANAVGKPGGIPLDGEVKLELGKELRASFFVSQKNMVLVDANARVGATTGALQDPAKLSAASIALTANIGPLQLADAQKLVQPKIVDPAHQQPPIAGTLEGMLEASGSLHNPKLTANLRVQQLQLNHQRQTGDITLSFVYAQAKEALQLAMQSHPGGTIEIKANTALDLSYPAVKRPWDLKRTPLAASLVADRFDPAFLSHLSTVVDRLAGEIDGKGKLWGTLGAPRGAGQLEWKNGIVETGGFGDFRELHLLALASNDGFQLKDLSMKSGDGSAKMTGFAQREGDRFYIHAVANLDKFPAMSDGELMANLSLNATADGNASASRVFIRTLDIPEAHFQLPDVKKKDLQKLAPAKDIVLTIDGKPIKGQEVATALVAPSAATGVGGSGSEGEAAAPTPFHVVIRVNAPRNLWIQGNDVNTEIGLSNGFRVEYGRAPMVFGDVNLLRGRLEVFGRRFDWQKDSKVTFEGAVLEPDLDVTAVYKNETEGVTVYLKAQGRGDRVKLTPTSDPPLSETEIYTLLATGHTTLRHGSGNTSPAGTAASLVGSFAAGQLKKTLSSVLPLDVFSIEAGDNGLQGTKLEAGTYVNDRLYIGFTGRVGADPMKGENADQVNLDYELSKHWSLQGSYGDAQAGGADLVWRKDY